MAFTIYHSNHLEYLQEMASYIIDEQPLNNPLSAEYFIIHSSGMTNWLKSTLASRHGIFANTRLEFPINQIVTIIEDLLSDEEKSITNLRLSRLTLTWAVYDVLINLDSDELEALKEYLVSNHTIHHDVRTMGLAEEIAGLFDKYLAYRPEWFAAWQKNELVFNDSPYEIWQQKIWQKVHKKIIEEYYLANITTLLKTLPSSRYRSDKIPERLFIIGISTLPSLFIELLHILSEHIDVHLFFTNPSQFYWGDLTQYRNQQIPRIQFKTNESRENLLSKDLLLNDLATMNDEVWLAFHGNPLLASFGKIGRDFIHGISQYDDIREIEAFDEPTTAGLLGEIQKNIYHLTPVNNHDEKYQLLNNDDSISIHSHYSERREVEGLYDHLLHCFNKDSSLKPKDIIVMVSDIDRYRPMIEAVFGTPSQSNAKIPFTISDFTLGKNEPILDAFQLLLSITDSHFTVTELLMLLEIPEISEKFHIAMDDRVLIKQWIEKTNIRFGIDDQHLKALSIREDFTNTWLWGLKRLLLGYAFSESIMIDGVDAFPHVQGGESIVLGHLADFVDALIVLKEKLSIDYDLNEWRTLLSEIWHTFYVENEETQYRLLHLQSIWNTFIDEGLSIGFNQHVSIHIIDRHLREHLSSFRPESHFLTGSVNFCTFIPMRSIPFKIVCMLGMNQDDFPHKKQYPEYDLMQANPKRGDRSLINDERYLFLEALLSAKDKLYISYIGKNIHNNSEMFPSLFVNELMHYITEIVCDDNGSVEKRLIVQHPLSPFSATLFEAGSQIQSFQQEWLPSLHDINDENFQPKLEALHRISIKGLIDCFKDPLKTFSLHHFNISFYASNQEEIENDELFSMSLQDRLEAYNERLSLLEALFYNELSLEALPDYARHELFERYQAEGKLPKFAFAKLDWQTFVEPMLQLVLEAKVNDCQYGDLITTTLSIHNVLIEGTLPKVFDQKLCLVFVGDLNRKRKFESYLTHLLSTVHLQSSITTKILYYQKGKILESGIEPIAIDIAKEQLKDFIEGYTENLNSPFIIDANEEILNKGESKIAMKHQEFIKDIYHHYDDNVLNDYLLKHEEFKIKVMTTVLEQLSNSKSLLIERFIEIVGNKECISYLYFWVQYENMLKFSQSKILN